MKKGILGATVGIAGMIAGTTNGGTTGGFFWDNGPPNGENGFSNATEGVFGARRTLLDDFVVENHALITEFHWEHTWNNLPPGSGFGMELSFLSDAGGRPGLTVATPEIFAYSEMSTGRTWFSRPGAESWVRFREALFLEAGTYWFEATIVGPENNFWLTADVRNEPCWVNYDDAGGLQRGRDIFGVDSDLNFVLVPTPGALPLLVLVGLARRRRREWPAVRSERTLGSAGRPFDNLGGM